MKIIITILLLSSCIFGCKNKELSNDQLSKITVVRHIEKKRNSIQQQNSESDSMKIIQEQNKKNAIKRFHIIVASYQSKDKINAEKLVQKLIRQKHHAELISSANRYRVSIANFTNEQAANGALDKYKGITQRNDIWVYKEE